MRVDLHAFLWAAQEGDRVWHAGPERSAEAIAAYRRALSVYTGPLLRGRELDFFVIRLRRSSNISSDAGAAICCANLPFLVVCAPKCADTPSIC